MELTSIKQSSPDWIQICGEPAVTVAEGVHERVRGCVAEGDFSWDEIAYIAAVSMKATSGSLRVNDMQLEKIRRACQVWDVDLRSRPVTSHRPLIGPCIVAGKKLLYPILRAFLKDFLRQQRAFNAAVLALVIDLYAEGDLQSGSADSVVAEQGSESCRL